MVYVFLNNSTIHIPTSTKVKLFDSTCVTVLLYGCESWVISKDMENKINSFELPATALCWTSTIDIVPNTTIYNLTETAILVVRARTRQLKFLLRAYTRTIHWLLIRDRIKYKTLLLTGEGLNNLTLLISLYIPLHAVSGLQKNFYSQFHEPNLP